MKNRIKSANSINQQGTKVFTISEGGVALIKDNIFEYENSIKCDTYNKIES